MRIAVICTIVVVALWGVTYGILAWIPTVPVKAYWNLTMPATRFAYGSLYVEPFVAVYSSHAATNMVLDSKCLNIPSFLKLTEETVTSANGKLQ